MLMRILVFFLLAFPALAAPPAYKYYIASGSTPCATIESLDAAYGGASGLDGGIMTASISGNQLTVTAINGGPLISGAPLGVTTLPLPSAQTTGSVSLGAVITSGQTLGSGLTIGATGTYTINNSQTVASSVIYYGHSQAWFPIVVLQNGVCAAQVHTGDAYYDITWTPPITAKFPNGTPISLTVAQQSALVTRESEAALLPDTMTLAAFEAILTTAQLTALNAASLKTSHPQLYADWQEVQAAGYYDMEDPLAIDLSNQALLLAGGLALTTAQYNQLTTPIATAPGP